MRSLLLALAMLLGCWANGSAGRAQAPPPESARAARIKADLQRILSSGDYRVEKPGENPLAPVGKWISDRWREFTDWLRRIFSFGGRVGTGSSPILPYVLVVALILLIAYAIAYALKNYKAAPRLAKQKPTIDTLLEPEETATAEPDAWIAAARRHAAAGDYRRAYRAAFIAVLIRMDRAGALRFERSKTNGDYVRSVRAKPKLLEFLRPLVNDFDARWYGRVEATNDDFLQILSAYDSAPGVAI